MAIVTASRVEPSLIPWRGSWAVAVAGTLLACVGGLHRLPSARREMATELLVRRRVTELRESEEKCRRLAETALRQLDASCPRVTCRGNDVALAPTKIAHHGPHPSGRRGALTQMTSGFS